MKTTFTELGLGEALVCALEKKGYTEPTPIQEQAIPKVLGGADLLATAQTGTGKTASFALPMLQRLMDSENHQRDVRALILTPTRELAEQIDRNIKVYSSNVKMNSAVLVGGVSVYKQRKQLQKRPAIVVATPGRLMDLLQQGMLSLEFVETLVLDEADRMLDMGFINDVRQIVKDTPRERQTLLFSATMSKKIIELSRSILNKPERVEIAPSATIAENLTQSVFFVEQDQKRALLTSILKEQSDNRVLVFARTKHGANKLAEQLYKSGISADAIHSNKSQGARRRTLADFDRGKIKVLVATDVVARGIDVKEITHVINFELPEDAENYVHRIGRTARAEQSGVAYTFCDSSEVGTLQAIERFIKMTLQVEEDHPFHSERAAQRSLKPQAARKRQQGGGGRRGARSGGGSSQRRRSGGAQGGSGNRRRSASQGGRSSNGSGNSQGRGGSRKFGGQSSSKGQSQGSRGQSSRRRSDRRAQV